MTGRPAPRAVRLLGCAAVLLSACSGNEPADSNSCAGGAILGGSPAPGTIAFSAAVKATLASLLIDLGGGDIALCSGVMVSPRALLTARHCLETSDSAQFTAFLGDPLDATAPKGTVGAITPHDTLDVALLSVDFQGRAPGAAPVPLLEDALDDTWVGAPVDLAGYGVGDDGDAGILSFATESIASLEPDHIVVTGQGQSGACVGDSGGPLFGTTPDGRVRVLGLLDDGSASCLGQDRYTRVDRLRDWEPLEAALVQPGGGCGSGNPRD